MTTHRNAALARVCVVAATVLGTLIVAAPAHAAGVNLSIAQNSFDLSPGDSSPLRVTLENTDDQPAPVALSINPPDGLADVQVRATDAGCNASGCAVVLGPNKSRTFTFNLVVAREPTGVPPGGVKEGDGTVEGAGTSKSFHVKLHGVPQTQSPTVAQISGSVRDSTTGSALKGATVAIQDSGACGPGKCETGTDSNGQFKFTSTPGKPITPGNIQIGARKTGYEISTTSVDARAGQSVSVTLKLTASAEATSSATADPLPTQDGQQPTGGVAAPPPVAATPKTAGNSGPSALSWIILVLAGLLVLLGVGVFVVLFINRRKGDDDAEDDGNPVPDPHGVPGTQRMYPTPDPTMMGRPAGMTRVGTAMTGADNAATTILHAQRPEDEFPDPYAAPYHASPPNYPPPGAGYGNDGFGSATQVGGYTQGPPAGYDTGAQAYGAAPAGYAGSPAGHEQPGYEPQGGYGSPAGYGAAPAGYGAAPAGYSAAPAGYGTPPAGYEQQADHGAAAPRHDEATRRWEGDGYPADQGAGYPPQRNGYDHSAGYGTQSGGYEPRVPGYDQPRAGYEPGYAPDQPDGGYDPYYQDPTAPGRRSAPPPAGRREDRQRLDWLDD